MKRPFIAAILGASGGAFAQPSIEPWFVSRLEKQSTVVAMSLNESGGGLLKSCSTDGCFWIVAVNVNCEDGHEYSGMMNSNAGALPLRLVCSPNAQAPGRYIIKDPDSVDSAVRAGGVVGVAFPMKNGEFRVARFRVDNWGQAERQLLDLTRKLPPSTKEISL